MATKGTIEIPISDGFKYVVNWSFPLNKSTKKVFADITYDLVVPYEATIEILTSPTVSIHSNSKTMVGQGDIWSLWLNNYFYHESVFGDNGNTREVSLKPGTYRMARTNEDTNANYQTYSRLDVIDFYDGGIKWFSLGAPKLWIDGVEYDPDSSETIPDIDRPDELASTITCATTYIGEQAVIIIDKYDTSYTTTITYQFGNLTGNVISKTSATQVYWLLEGDKFLSQMNPAATAGTCKLTAYTYDKDGNQMGSPKTIQFTVLMDSNAAGPLFNPTVSDINNATIALTGDSGILIKYFSNARVNAGAVGQAGATIKSVSIENAGIVVNSSTATFNNVESPIFNITAVDSRVFTSKTAYRATMVEYSKLSCNLLVSTPTVSGDATITIEGNYYNGSFGATNNTLTVKYRMKTGNGSYGAWQTVSVSPSGSNYKVEIDLSGLDYQQLYSFQAMATDKLMTITTKEVQSIGRPVYDWGQNDFHVSVDLNVDKSINMLPDQSIAGTTPEGELINAFVPCDSIGNTVLGYGSYTNETGAVKIYGNQVDIIAANGVSINGTTLGGKVLYQGGYMMSANQKISLPEAVSDQANGIVLVFSLYRNGAAEDVSISTFYVSKKEVELLDGAPHFFFMGINAGFSVLGAKYIYISDTEISGHEGNDDTGSNNGLTFNNASFVLRYVLGV